MQGFGMTVRTRVAAGVLALLALTGVGVASIAGVLPPAAASADAPADQFSADRAYQSVRVIGEKVHVTGSPAAADVRGYIVDTLTTLGYQPEVHEGIGQTDNLGGPAMAHVQNVVTSIRGTDSTGQVIMMAHYDSVQVSYGANDDGAGVATLLETARALTNSAALRNDVVLLFTDAEEACLCGAESFVHGDPAARAGSVVLNFEARGTSGPSIMFETGRGNADLISHYAAAVPYPVATSMAVEIYRILPNDTDFTPFLDAGEFNGLNSAYIDGSAAYHSPEDRPEYMDTGSLQAHGSNALALVRQLGNADLTDLGAPGSHDATYFPVFGSLVQYSGMLVWPLAVLALLAAAGLIYLVHARRHVGWGRMVSSGLLMLVPLIASAIAAQLYWWLLTTVRPDYAAMIDPWRPGWYRVALCGLVVAVTVGWYLVWRRRFDAFALWSGGLGWLAVLGVVMAAATPGGAYLATVPALVAAIAGALGLVTRRWWIGVSAQTVAGCVAVVVLAPTVVLFFPALGLATGAAAALIGAMLVITILPTMDLLHPRIAAVDPAGEEVDRDVAAIGAPHLLPAGRPWYVAGGAVLVAAVVTIAGTVVGLVVDRFDAAHPRPTQLMYALDADTATATWVSTQDDPGGWTGQYITGSDDLSDAFPMLDGTVSTGPADPADVPAPSVTVDADTTIGGERTVTVTVTSHRMARLLDVSAPGATVRAATVTAGAASRDVDLTDAHFSMLFHGPPEGSIQVTLTVVGNGPLTLRVLDGSDGLESLPGFVPRPSDVGVQGSHTSELVLVGTTVTV